MKKSNYFVYCPFKTKAIQIYQKQKKIKRFCVKNIYGNRT